MQAMAINLACNLWVSMIEAGLEQVDEVPAMLMSTLDVVRGVQGLTDPSRISPGECHYDAIAALAGAAKRTDKSYITTVGVALHANTYFKE